MQQVGDGVSPGRNDPDDARGQSRRAAVSAPATAQGGGAARDEAACWSEPWLSQLILDHARDGIAVLDMAGRMRWMNPAL